MWCDLRMVDARAGEEEPYTEDAKRRAAESAAIGAAPANVTLSQWLASVGASSFAQLFLVGALCSRAEFAGKPIYVRLICRSGQVGWERNCSDVTI